MESMIKHYENQISQNEKIQNKYTQMIEKITRQKSHGHGGSSPSKMLNGSKSQSIDNSLIKIELPMLDKKLTTLDVNRSTVSE